MPSMAAIDLSTVELRLIAEDQESYLAGMHVEQEEECEDLASCPLSHFDLSDPFSLDENPGKSETEMEILHRQALIRKIDPFLTA